MKSARHLMLSALLSIHLLAAGNAHATANVGGVISASFAEAAGDCNKTVLAGPAVRDTLQASLNAPCQKGSVTGDIRAGADTASVGLRVAANGTGYTASQVSLSDEIVLTPPAGTAVGTYAIPVTFHLDGEISPGTKSLEPYYLYYTFSIMAGFDAGSFSERGRLTAAGSYSQSFDWVLNVQYFGPGNLISAVYSIGLTVPTVSEGTVDFYNTAGMGLSLPAGWVATTSSGLPLVSAVPEPSVWLGLLLGLGWLCRRRAAMLR